MQNTKDRPVTIAGKRKNRVPEEATRLGISEGTLKKYVKDGIIPALKIRTLLLFDPDEVDAALAALSKEAK
jgi:excisionase family DNA binding protein